MKRNNQLPLLKNIQFAKQMWNCYHIFIFATTKSLSVRHNTTKHKMCKERKKIQSSTIKQTYTQTDTPRLAERTLRAKAPKEKTVTTVTKKQTVII
jgi:predicted aspartyl protease